MAAISVLVYIVTQYNAHWESWRMRGAYTSQQDAESYAQRLYDDDKAQRHGVVVERLEVNTANALPLVVLHLNVDRDDD